MSFLDRGKRKRADQLRKSGTRVPARLARVKASKFNRVSDTDRMSAYRGTDMTMSWEAQTPEGGIVPFEVKARWAPEEGVFLEAACDDAREEAVLMMDLASMSVVDDDNEEIRRQLRVSMANAESLRTGAPPPSEESLSKIDGAPPEGTKSLRDMLG